MNEKLLTLQNILDKEIAYLIDEFLRKVVIFTITVSVTACCVTLAMGCLCSFLMLC